MRVLVTGGGGFLAKYVNEELKKNRIDTVETSYKTDGDLTGIKTIKKLKRKSFGVIIHIAGVTNMNVKQHKIGYRANVIMMKRIVHLAKSRKNTRIIFISSNAVNYRNDAFALSKKRAEKILIESKLNYLILRPTLISGKGSKEEAKLVWWLKMLKIIPLPVENKIIINPINPKDLARLIVKAVGSRVEGIYTVGGQDISIRDYGERLIRENDLKVKTINIGRKLSKLLEGIIVKNKTDNEKLGKVFGWRIG